MISIEKFFVASLLFSDSLAETTFFLSGGLWNKGGSMNDPRGIRVLEGMATDVLGRPQPKRIENGESSRMGLQGVELHCGLHQQQSRNWRTNGGDESTSADGSDGDEEPDEDDDAEDEDIREGDDEVDGLVSIRGSNAKHNTNSSDSVQSSSEKFHSEKANLRDHSSFGIRREALMKDLNHIRGTPSEQLHHHEPIGNYDNAITVVEPEQFCSQVLHGGDGPTLARKQFKQQGGENGFSLCGNKEMKLSMDPTESLRGHLSDPITGVLMDDAMILSCGHSFGSSGMQHIYRMKACYKCLQLISEDSIRPNLSLRYAVQAFLREEESQYLRPPKRRRERLEQEKCMYDESISMDSRGKGVLFPFVISDRVIIKGNKRTPQRFVGRVAVVTTQCLNGWYVVKTLDNAESVKLQYRSLAKVTDVAPSITIAANKPVSPSWL